MVHIKINYIFRIVLDLQKICKIVQCSLNQFPIIIIIIIIIIKANLNRSPKRSFFFF